MGRTQAALIAVAAGVASALFHMAGLVGASAFLGYGAPLPLLFAGLTQGGVGIAIAALVALATVLVAGGGAAALSLVVLIAAPSVLVVHLGLRSRTVGSPPPAAETPSPWAPAGQTVTEWYPPGRLLVRLGAYGMLVMAVAVVLAAGQDGGLAGVLARLIEAQLTLLAEQLQAGGAGPEVFPVDRLGPEDFAALAVLVPAVATVMWLAILVVNGRIAQGLAMMAGWALRPPMGLEAVEMPRWLPLVGAVAGLAVAVLDGGPRILAAQALALVTFGYLLAGLGAVHALIAHRGDRLVLLAVVYGVLLLAPLLAAPMVAAFGGLDQWLGLRARAGTGGRAPDDDEED